MPINTKPFLVSDQSIEDAIIDGDTEKVKILLEKGVDVESVFDDFTILLRAAFEGHADIVELILDKGADIDANDSEGYTALIWAVDFKHTEIVKLLIRRVIC